MAQSSQNEIWNPFGEQVDGLSAKERVDIWRANCWAHYLNGGGGDPSYFDYPAWLKSRERS